MFDEICQRLQEGQNIMVRSTKGKFYGKFKKMSLNGMRIDLEDVKDISGSTYRFMFFLKKDVQLVEVPHEEIQEMTSSISSEISSSNTYQSLSPKQLIQINDTIHNRVLIQQADSIYADALLNISKQFVIGICAEGTSKGRIYNMHLLAISTVDKIYIFDVIALDSSKMMNEMKEIFESDEILKVAHDCRGIKDNFKTKFNIDLETFDLMLIAAQFYLKSEVITLSKCVQTVLGLSNVNDNEIILKRPFAVEAFDGMALKIAYHIAMFHKLIQKDFSQRFKQQSEELTFRSKGVSNLLESISGPNLMTVLSKESPTTPIDYSIYS